VKRFDLHLLAPAKINLILRVISRREDGYHELETWMTKVDLYDSIFVRLEDKHGIRLRCAGSAVPLDESNLLWRAAALFLENSSRAAGKGMSLYLEKNIPVAAGLGGGSSDAGTLLRGLNVLWGNEFDDNTLIEFCQSLGADVPFFTIEAKSVLATGIGERMIPVAAPANCLYLLVNPGIAVSTAEIFAKFALTRKEKNSTLTGSQKLDSDGLRLEDLENDLEDVTIKLFPIIADVKNHLQRLDADFVLMSGSGPTVFGVYTNISENRKRMVTQAAIELRRRFGDKVYITE
jgi:4-diphosphocytidyl-2-C-methyl-D-erythritol kinase